MIDSDDTGTGISKISEVLLSSPPMKCNISKNMVILSYTKLSSTEDTI